MRVLALFLAWVIKLGFKLVVLLLALLTLGVMSRYR